jgi:hypothetical protein
VRRGHVLLGALPVAASLLAACSSSPGPLGTGGTGGTQCISYREGSPVTMGLYVLENTGTIPATVTGISLPPDAHGLTMTSAWLVPIYHDLKNGNHVAVGVGWDYPPPVKQNPQWPQRRPAIGGTVKPGQDLNLVFGLVRTTAKDGASGGPVVTYRAGGNSYTMQMAVRMIVSPRCA